MLVRLTPQNQVTLPESVASAFEGTEYFEAAIENDRTVLTPSRLTGADAVRFKLGDLGLCEADVGEAVSWAAAGRCASVVRQILSPLSLGMRVGVEGELRGYPEAAVIDTRTARRYLHAALSDDRRDSLIP